MKVGVRRKGMAAAIGNVLEWYDFTVYGYFAVSIGKQFFPGSDASLSVIAAFGVFAIGFLARPLGGVIFGHLGDILGRRRVMAISVLAMAVPTFLVGLLPGYDTLGVMAPMLLIVLRLFQGLSVGGEITSAVTYMVEDVATARNRAFMGSLPMAGTVVGTLLGSGVGAVVTGLLSADQVAEWGWRIPFLLGIVVAVFGFILRRGSSARGPAAASGASGIPLARAWRCHRADLLRAVGITAYDSTAFYLMFIYATTFLTEIVHDDARTVFDINTAVMVVLCLAVPGFAWLGDRIGIHRICLLSAAAGIFLAIPLFALMDQSDPWLTLAGQIGMVLIVAPYAGCFATRIALLFPGDVRMSSFSVAYSIGFAVFGGAAPAVAAAMIAHQAGDWSPAYLVTGAAVISFVSLLSARRSPS